MATQSLETLLLTVDEAAQSLRICSKTLAVWTKAGKIVPTRIGARVFYSRKSLERFIEQQEREAVTV